jgi:membrane protein DedA with SNARE-associated domain
MTVAGFIAEYGYAALFIGTLLEGETVLILAGFAAHQGYLQLHWVIALAGLGGFLGDQFYFWLGRWRADWVARRFTRVTPVLERANALIDRYQDVLIVVMRFLYGLRTVAPIAFGMSKVPMWRFALLNAAGAAVWAIVIGGAGYLFGQVLRLWLNDLKRIEEALLLGMLSVGMIVWAWRRWKLSRELRR